MPTQACCFGPSPDYSGAMTCVPSENVAHSPLSENSKERRSSNKRHRRCTVEIIIGHLGVLGREVRREIIAQKLNQQQRLAIERFISVQRLNLPISIGTDEALAVEKGTLPTNLKRHSVAKHPHACSGGYMFTRQCGPRRKIKPEKCMDLLKPCSSKSNNSFSALHSRGKLPIADSCNESQDVVRLSSHTKGNAKLYYATVGIDSLVLRCKSRADIQEVTEHQTSLQKIKCRITSRVGDFEARVIEAVSDIEEDRRRSGFSDWGLTVSVRVAATWWLGKDLTTPARTSQDIGVALSEWRKFREIRGSPRRGGKGILYHHSLHTISSMWSQLRHVYLNSCGSKGADIKKLSAKLDAKVAQRELHRRTQLRHWAFLKNKRLCIEQHREHRRAIIAARCDSRLQRREAKLKKMRLSREKASLNALERLIAKWSPSPMKRSAVSLATTLP